MYPWMESVAMYFYMGSVTDDMKDFDKLLYL